MYHVIYLIKHLKVCQPLNVFNIREIKKTKRENVVSCHEQNNFCSSRKYFNRCPSKIGNWAIFLYDVNPCARKDGFIFYHTRPCAYQWFQGCACKVCETHRLKAKWQKRTGQRSPASVTQLCLSQCMTSQWCNHSDYCCNHSDHLITIGH